MCDRKAAIRRAAAARWAVIVGVLVGCSKKPAADVHVLARFEPALPVLRSPEPVEANAPKTIVSLIPSCTEWLFALGIGDRVIGVDRWADFPPEATRLPRLGDLNSVEKEKILDLHPDLLLSFERHRDAGSILAKAGLNVAFPPTEAVRSVDEGVRELARLAGVTKRAEQAIQEIRATLERTEREFAGKPRVRVLVVFERLPSFSVAARSSFIHRMIEAAGGENVSADIDRVKHFAYASLEKILDWRPEVIIDLSAGVAGAKECDEIADFWRRSYPDRAVIYVTPSPVLARPGPRTGESVRYLARLIHGS